MFTVVFNEIRVDINYVLTKLTTEISTTEICIPYSICTLFVLVNDNTKNETLDIASTDITLHHSIIKSIGSLKGMAKSV